MKQQNIFITTLIVFIACISFSCQPALGSAWYRSSAPQGRNSGQHNIEEEEQQAPKDPNAFIEVNPFDYFTKNYLYSAAEFDKRVLYMTKITPENIASYKFDNTAQWVENGNGEYKYEGIPGKGAVIGEGQQNNTTNLTYYMYKDRKARWVGSNKFDPNLDEEEKKRQERFYFYRFTGTTTGDNGFLDNSTFCVDTYSKFLFFYSEPAEKKVVFGNTIPSDWQDYESPPKNHHIKQDYKFYQYDPVGFVKEDGNVIIYNWFKNRIAKSEYGPVMNEKFKYAAKAGDNYMPGCSPYKDNTLKIYTEDEPESHHPPVLSVAPVSLKNVSVNGLHWDLIVVKWVSKLSDPFFSYSFKTKVSYKGYQGSEEELEEYNHGNASGSLNKLKAIKPGEEIKFTTTKLFRQEIPLDAENLEAELIVQIIKYNSKTTLFVTESTEEEYITKFDNPIKLTYDKKNKKWHCPAANKKEIFPGVKISYPEFNLTRKSTKNFKITFESEQPNANGDIEVSYMIGWQ